ncbi:mucin-5AC-like isoform X3 [Pecten maximus]|uniref:mucin-5AC-like isoform X3 n=1 Tax=Pecten maximus TaxID=6579 RepID=UPI001458A56E|nr:mucin-5AC-like isoform X3 [Pecten maximus]
MSSGSGEITPIEQGAVGGQEDEGAKVTFEDGRGDGKKKKFKPLERMFKFFKSGKKRSKSKERDPNIVSVKSKSTSALYKEISHGDEDEEDGGFKRMPLGGTRSISEDSVFNPEQRDLTGMRKTAVSMENIKQDFRTELFSKLRKRQSTMSSDEDEDDFGFQQSTHVSYDEVTTRGRPKILVMDYHRMYLPPPVEGKPGSQDSSLSADLTEDVFFNTSWQESVGGTTPQKPVSSPGKAMDMDLNAVKSDSQVLDSEAAKHKISIKPRQRRASSQRARTKPSGGAASLPQVKEESPPKELASPVATLKSLEDEKPVEANPTKEEITDDVENVKTVDHEPLITVEDNKTSIQIGGKDKPDAEASTGSPSQEMDSPSKRWSMTEGEKDKMPGLPVSPVALGAVKLRTRPRPKSLIEPPQLPPSGDELAKAFNKRLSVRKERTNEEFSEEDFLEAKKDSNEVTPVVQPSDGKKTSPTGAAPSTGGITYVLKKEPLRKTSSSDSAKTPQLKAVSEEPNKTDQPKPKVTETKAEPVKIEVPQKDNVPPSVQEKSKSLTNKLASPREEYRLKRQSRSKTLPVQPVSQEFLDKKVNDIAAASSNLSQSVKEESKEGKADPLSSALSKKSEPKRLSLKETSNAAEPLWFAVARRKQADAEKEEREAAKKENSPPVGAKINPSPSSGGAKTTPLQSSVGAKTPPLQSSLGPKPTPGQSSVSTKPTPGQSSVSTKPTPGQSLAGTKPTPGQSLAGTKPTPGQSSVSTKPTPGQSLAGTKPTPGQSLAGTKPTPGPLSVGTKPTPGQSSVSTKPTPGQSLAGTKPTPGQSLAGTKPTPGQSAVGTKTNPSVGIKPNSTDSPNTSSANKEVPSSVRSFRDNVSDKSESTPFNRGSVKSSGFSSKEEKEKINGNKKAPETKKESEPVQRTLSNRSKFEAKSSTTGGGSQASTSSSSSSSSSSVPAWKANLAKKKEKEPQIKIEIIEKKTEKPVPPKKPSKALEEERSHRT